MGHEASVSKISEDQLFYLMSRGMTEDEATATIVRGFVEPIARELPMEYALELEPADRAADGRGSRLMTALQGAVESTAPVSRLHEHQSFSLDDFPVPSGP